MVADSTSALRALLAHHALFVGRSEAELQRLAESLRTVHLGPGDAAPDAVGTCLVTVGALQSDGRLLRAGDVFRPAMHTYAVAPSTVLLLPEEAVHPQALATAAAAPEAAAHLGALDIAAAAFLQSLCVLLGALPLGLAKPLIDRGVLMRDATLAPLLLGGLAMAAVALGASLGLRQMLLTAVVSHLRTRLGARTWREALHQAARGEAAPVRLQDRLQRQATRLLALSVRAPALLHDWVAVPVYAALLVWVSPRVTLWGATGVGISLAVWAVWYRRNRRAQAASRRHEVQLTSFIEAYGGSPWRPHQRMAAHLEAESRASAQRAQRNRMRGSFYTQGARTAMLVAVLALGTHAARHDSMSLGTLVASAGLLDGLAAALGRLLTAPLPRMPRRPQGLGTSTAQRRPAPTQQTRGAVPRGAVQLRGVRLTYPEAEAVLWDLDLDLEPGEAVVVCGPSGAGKTTLARLLCGAVQPQAGHVRIDGTAPPIAALHSLGRTPWIWHGTLRENLAMHDTRLSDEALRGAARLSGWNLDALPMGLDTQLRSEGALDRLHATQLALARALLQRPCVLVLDDALEGLDADRRADLVRRMQACTPRPTLVLLGRTPMPVALGLRTLHLHQGRLVAA